MDTRPILFLDFDRTLFDTEQFASWLGNDHLKRLSLIEQGKLLPPDFRIMLYPESVPFLQKARRTHRLVILSFAKSLELQHRKLHGSGILAYVDDVIITQENKGIAAQKYITQGKTHSGTDVFIDDKRSKIDEVKRVNPSIRCYLMARGMYEPTREIEDASSFIQPDATVSSLEELLLLLK